MKKLFLIIFVLVGSGSLRAQNIAKTEPLAKSESTVSDVLPDAVEFPSYKVTCLIAKKDFSFEITSPKSDKAEVKLVNTLGAEIFTIHKGLLREGKNVFNVPSKKIAAGIYYVVSKLANGEQFADRVVLTK